MLYKINQIPITNMERNNSLNIFEIIFLLKNNFSLSKNKEKHNHPAKTIKSRKFKFKYFITYPGRMDSTKNKIR